MSEIHPSSTGGYGKRIPQRQQKPGDPIRYILKCYQCGYSFREDRDTRGEAETDGNVLTPVSVVVNNIQSKLPKPLQGMASFAVTSKTVIDPVVTYGCPFCGSLNPEGSGDDRDFFSTVDLSDK